MDGMVKLMTTPPGSAGSADLWMTVSDVFYIPGRGTVATGRLQGNIALNVGDTLVCDGGRWTVTGIEQYKLVITTAKPGSNIAVMLKKGPGGDVLRDRTVTFEPAPPASGQKKRLWRR
jgi:translation elongation factor EF-Tu-like GTPase